MAGATALNPAADASLPARAGRFKFVLWMALLAALFAGFILLGNWQVRRERWKLGLIHAVNTRVHAPAIVAPGPEQWPTIAAGHLQYLHVRLTGHYLAGGQTLVRGASKMGYGFWVMAPFATDRGFIVLVNRGYVAVESSAPPPLADVTLTGLLRFSEPGGGFLRPNHPRANQWYSRDVAAIAAARSLPAGQVAPYFVDADATAMHAGEPVAGLTRIQFRNPHVGYAITWYLLALGTLLGAGFIVRDQWQGRRSPAA